MTNIVYPTSAEVRRYLFHGMTPINLQYTENKFEEGYIDLTPLVSVRIAETMPELEPILIWSKGDYNNHNRTPNPRIVVASGIFRQNESLEEDSSLTGLLRAAVPGEFRQVGFRREKDDKNTKNQLKIWII